MKRCSFCRFPAAVQKKLSLLTRRRMYRMLSSGAVSKYRNGIWKPAAPLLQGGATLEGAEFAITSLNDNPVVVDGKTYQKDEVVLTIKTDASGLASTAADALPYGSYRVDEVTPPTGYLGEGTLSAEFTISKNGEMVDLTGEDNSISNQIIRGGVKVQKA